MSPVDPSELRKRQRDSSRNIGSISSEDMEGIESTMPDHALSSTVQQQQQLVSFSPVQGSAQQAIAVKSSPLTPTQKHHVCTVARAIRGELDVLEIEMSLQALADDNADLFNTTNENGMTLLHMCVLLMNEAVLRKLVFYGADINYVASSEYRSALFAAAHAPSLPSDAKENMVKLLFALGADPDLCPAHSSGERPLPVDQMHEVSYGIQYHFARARLPEVRRWFGREASEKMKDMAVKIALPTLVNIRELWFYLVGQHLATSTLISAVRDWAFELPSLGEKSSCLALMFAGPSGHGKTEEAKKLAIALCGNDDGVHKVDCAQTRTASEIFGLGGAFQGARAGSALNNFLKKRDNQIGVVVFDELEKAEKEVRTQLLNIIDKGEFVDKQLADDSQSRVVNCRKIIFIFTTNAFDPLIMEETKQWGDRNSAEVSEKHKRKLERKLRKQMQEKFEICFAGRIQNITCFVPFCSPPEIPSNILDDETRVLINMEVAKTISWFEDEKRNLQDNIAVSLDDQDRDKFCELLRGNYHREEGVRCIHRMLGQRLRQPVIKVWHEDNFKADTHMVVVAVSSVEEEVDVQKVRRHDSKAISDGDSEEN